VGSAIDDGIVLITGASSGIGEAIARRVAPRAKGVALVARRIERLEALKKELTSAHPGLEVLVVPTDLTDRDATEAAVDAIIERLGPVDVLVNNAGFGDLSLYDLSDWDKNERMIELNVRSPAYLTHRVVPGMVERGRGGIINISSGFGLQFMPGFAGYVGTKHFVSGFTECLRLDMHKTGVVVTQICPGPVDTEFESKVGNFVGRKPPGFVTVSADHVARVAVGALDRRRALVVPGFWMKLTLFAGEWTPRWLLRRIYRYLVKPLRKKQASASG